MSGFLKKALGKGEKDDPGKHFERFHSTSFEGKTFLHGHLNISILAGKDLPDMESWISKLVDKKDVTDPFVDVKLGSAKLVKTRQELKPIFIHYNYRLI